MNFGKSGNNLLILFMIVGFTASVLSYNDLQTNAYAQSDMEENQRETAQQAEREARADAADAEREARQAAQQAEREARHLAEDIEREARADAADAEREARTAAENIEREARVAAADAEREARTAAENIEREARVDAADAEREARSDAADAERDAETMQQRGLAISEAMRERGLAMTERMQQRGLDIVDRAESQDGLDVAQEMSRQGMGVASEMRRMGLDTAQSMALTGINIGETMSERRAIAEIKSEVIVEELGQKIRHDVLSMDSRVHSLLERLELGRYHLPDNISEDEQKISLNTSFEGQTRESVPEHVVGSIFLENIVTRGEVTKYKVTGGEILVGDTAYDVVFGKARLVTNPENDVLVILGQIMDIDGNVSTFRLGIESDELKDVTTIGSADFELAPQSKIANKHIQNGETVINIIKERI